MPRAKKPTVMKLLHGNRKSTFNVHEPQFSVSGVQCPVWLTPIAAAEWERIMKEFEHTGLVTNVDQAALATYCQSYARYLQAEAEVERLGIMIQEEITDRAGKGTGRYRWKRNPATIVSKDERAIMLGAGRLFGMNPSSRSAMAVPENEQDEQRVDKGEELDAIDRLLQANV